MGDQLCNHILGNNDGNGWSWKGNQLQSYPRITLGHETVDNGVKCYPFRTFENAKLTRIILMAIVTAVTFFPYRNYSYEM